MVGQSGHGKEEKYVTTEQRNRVLDEILKKCCFIGSKSIKVTEQDVEAIKEAQDLANQCENVAKEKHPLMG